MKMQMPISLKGETRVYGQTDYPVLLRFSLAFNSILPAKASWPSQINPHPSRTSHHLHPPPPPSPPPPGGARSRRAPTAVWDAQCHIQGLPPPGIAFFRFHPKCTSPSSAVSRTPSFSVGHGSISAFSEFM